MADSFNDATYTSAPDYTELFGVHLSLLPVDYDEATQTYSVTLPARYFFADFSGTDLAPNGEQFSLKAGVGYRVDAIPVDFSLSTSPDGNCGVGEAGSSGNCAGRLNWDASIIVPDNKDFYIEVTAKVTVPDEITLPATISVDAERIKIVNGVETASSGADNSDSIPLMRIDDPNDVENGAPVDGFDIYGNPTKTWTYRSHTSTDHIEGRISGTNDWHITKKLGRWRLRVNLDYGTSNKVFFKINKRAQIVNRALDWADFWPTRPEDSKVYEDVNDGNGGIEHFYKPEVYRLPSGQELFTQCHSFAAYMYGKHGLYATYSLGNNVACSGLQTDATAEDNGLAALRAFTGHTGVITGFGLLYGGQMVDDNNPGEIYDRERHGVYAHDWNFAGNDTLQNPPNISVPAPGTAADPSVFNPANGRPKSWLELLDGE